MSGGMGDSHKKTAVHLIAKTYEAAILCLQETHLTKVSTPQLRCRDYGTQFHSVHSSYSRGVSIFIQSGVAFSCIQSKIDELGQYIFLYCILKNRPCVVANVYLTPSSDVSILCRLAKFVLDKPGVPVLATGDFNMVMH